MRLILALVLVAAASGCVQTQGVRYVYQDTDFGVVGMPENTDRWPTHYRRQGEKLMAAHFPEGHEIVRAEEVIEGERTRKLEGSSSAELSPQDQQVRVQGRHAGAFGEPQRGRNREDQGVPDHLQAGRFREVEGLLSSSNPHADVVC